MRKRSLLLLLTVVLLSACGGKPQDDPEHQERILSADEQWNEITDRGWEVVSLEGKELIPGTFVDLHLSSDWKASGNAGCNTWYAFVSTRNGNRIRFTRLTQATKMECEGPDGVMEQEALFFELIQFVDGFSIENGELVLYYGDEDIMVLTPKLPPS